MRTLLEAANRFLGEDEEVVSERDYGKFDKSVDPGDDVQYDLVIPENVFALSVYDGLGEQAGFIEDVFKNDEIVLDEEEVEKNYEWVTRQIITPESIMEAVKQVKVFIDNKEFDDAENQYYGLDLFVEKKFEGSYETQDNYKLEIVSKSGEEKEESEIAQWIKTSLESAIVSFMDDRANYKEKE